MKKSIHKIIFPALLIANLLFGQLAVNFLHAPHEEHEPDVKAQSDAASVHRHGEHCKICSLDIVLNMLAAQCVSIHNSPEAAILIVRVIEKPAVLRIAAAQGRAPPVFS